MKNIKPLAFVKGRGFVIFEDAGGCSDGRKANL